MHLCSVVSLLRLLFLFPAPVAVETAVAGCVEGRDKDDRPQVNCTGAGFSWAPPGIQPATTVLLFPLNQFSEFSWTTFTTFTQIHEIDLSKNQISALSPSVAPILPSLSVLRLGSNQLRAVPDHCFSGSPALTELYLQNNLISSLHDRSFSGLSKLEILDLSDNHIKTLPPLMMHPLTTIETLYLEGNKIKVLPDDWFSKKEEVPYLYLSANPWACSCSLGYLHRYLDMYEGNVYVRDGPIINPDMESVICGSPRSLAGQPVVKLEESDFCDPLSPTESSPAEPTPTESAPTEPRTAISTARAHFFGIPTAGPTPPPTTTTATTTTAVDKYLTETYYKEVTWYEIYTSDWSEIWVPLRGDGRMVKKTTTPPTTEPPTSTTLKTTTTPPTTEPLTTPTTPPSTTFPTTTQNPSTSPTFSTTNPTEIPQTTFFTLETFKMTPTKAVSMVSNNGSSDKVSYVEARRVFCFWLFVSCVLLCIISAVSSLITACRLYFWYRGVYKSLKCIIVGKEQIRMVTSCRNINKQQAKYRTMLFVSKDMIQGEQLECFVNLGPKNATEQAQNVEKLAYKQEMYRVISKEEEIDAKDVLAECKASREANTGMSKKRYSVILREEGEKDGGETEKCDWVVGGWEVEKGAGPGSSWGEWLGQILPSMPWRVSVPDKSEAALVERRLSEKDE